ncbi:YaaC family protein [Sphingomonas sp. URHD0057]|uniref:YaaC family protein n=1 Tax=Sphingomonas sp. URHD0057 TaxID=1380389 RepID=UPI0006845114|nr:YaaC family protein [Sphingomonas sp. URHD0057]
MAERPLKLRAKTLRPHKARVSAQFEIRNVLANDPFVYVDLWLRRNHQEDARFFWKQAGAFYKSAETLPLEAKPLLLYYCFMNAVKALLSAKSIPFNQHHGVGQGDTLGKFVLSNYGIEIRNAGILPSLSGYYNETEPSTRHSLEDIFYNLVHIHRTYCLTYPRRRDLFLPLRDAMFVRDNVTGNTRVRAVVGSDVDWPSYRRAMPGNFTHYLEGADRVVESISTATLSIAAVPTAADLTQVAHLNQTIRERVKYIRGSQSLWYLKTDSPSSIAREQLTLTLAAMHRLSELTRYQPKQLTSLLDGQRNWLLTEFIEMSPAQFMDEIAAEITGHQILVPNVRIPA